MKTKTVAVVGLGYVGLPLVLSLVEKGFRTVGIDIDSKKPQLLSKGLSYLKHVSNDRIQQAIQTDRFHATSDFRNVQESDVVVVCVPTPLTAHREPDLKPVISSAEAIAPYLKPGQLVSLESTTFPGTTRQVFGLALEKISGLKAGEDFSLIYSPEREDPGNPRFHNVNTPKVVGGLTPRCGELGAQFYEGLVDRVVRVSSLEAAELTKLLENIFRSVNIALVNELKMLCHRFSDAKVPIDIYEVVEAASTKPFGYMPFFPGPGLGGHCIPIDPFYLTWKAREVDFPTRFIELAGEINTAMPYYVVERTARALSDQGVPLAKAKILVLGAAYKENVDDVRESPALKIMELLAERKANISYHDPFVPKLEKSSHFSLDLVNAELTEKTLRSHDAVLIVTAHQGVDYEQIAQQSRLIVDTRGILRKLQLKSESLVYA